MKLSDNTSMQDTSMQDTGNLFRAMCGEQDLHTGNDDDSHFTLWTFAAKDQALRNLKHVLDWTAWPEFEIDLFCPEGLLQFTSHGILIDSKGGLTGETVFRD